MGLALILLISCASRKSMNRSKYFSLERVTRQTTHGGVAGSGSTTTYALSIQVKKTADIVFLKGYADRKEGDIQAYKDDKFISTGRLKKGDELVLNVSFFNPPPVEDQIEPIETKPVDPPRTHDGELLVVYTINGKKGYLSLHEIEVLEDIFAP